MPETKDPFGENVSLLQPDSYCDKFGRFTDSSCETPIIRGVVNQFKKWPEALLFAFLRACVITASLVFLIFITIAICVPTIVIGNRLDEISILEVKTSPNVYFIKLENQNWSTKEFCYIETAARRHPEFNVYLINLIKEELTTNLNEFSNKTKLETKLNDSNDHHFSIPNPEDRLRQRLNLVNENIKNINISISKFFNSSKLSKIAKELDDDVLEIATKAQLLWTAPGIALKPNMFCNLDYIKNLFCDTKNECSPDEVATIDPGNDIQITGVPCQAFMGFVVQEISKSNHNGRYTMKEAVEKYCPRHYYCPEIRILNSKPKCPTDLLDCPVVYSSILMNFT